MQKKYLIVVFLMMSLSLMGQNRKLRYFYKKGIPNIEDSWNMADYQHATSTLLILIQDGEVDLPEYPTPAFRLLAKITDGSSYFTDRSGDLDQRLNNAGKLQNGIVGLTRLYHANMREVEGKYNYGKETLLLMTAIIYIADEFNKLMQEFLDQNPELTEIQLGGIKQMKRGMGEILSGGVSVIFDEYHRYAEEDICQFSEVFRLFFDDLLTMVDPEVKEELKQKMNNKDHKYPCVKVYHE